MEPSELCASQLAGSVGEGEGPLARPNLSVRRWTAGAVSGASELAGVGPRKRLDTSFGRAEEDS